MANLPDICVARKILSSEYQPYACGKNFSRALISTKFSDLWTNISWQRYRIYRRMKPAIWSIVAYGVGLTIALSPFTVTSYLKTGRPALTATGGFNLYLANNPDNPCPYYRPASFASSNPALQGIQFVIEASRRTGKKLTNREASSFWTREVFRLAIKDPAKFFMKLLQKALALFNRFEPADNFDIGFLSRFVSFLALTLFWA